MIYRYRRVPLAGPWGVPSGALGGGLGDRVPGDPAIGPGLAFAVIKIIKN